MNKITLVIISFYWLLSLIPSTDSVAFASTNECLIQLNETSRAPLNDLVNTFTQADHLSGLSPQQATELKSSLLEYFKPSIHGTAPLFLEYPSAATQLFESAFAHYRSQGDFQFLNELLGAFIFFNKSFPNRSHIVAELFESIDFDFPQEISFPTTAYHDQLPAFPMIVVSKLKKPMEMYVLDILVSVSKTDTYWKTTLLKELALSANPDSKTNHPIVGLNNRLNGHNDEIKYFDLDHPNLFVGHRSPSWPSGSPDSLNAIMVYLATENPNNDILQQFRKSVRAPKGLHEEPNNIDENNLIGFRLMSTQPLTLSDGQTLLKTALSNLRKALPTLGHGGFNGSWNWFVSRFEHDDAKSSVLFHDSRSLDLAQAMGFNTQKRKKTIQQIQNSLEHFLQDKESIFTFLRPTNINKIPSDDNVANATVIRALDGFYKELSKNPKAEYLHAPKKLQGWIEKKFFTFLLKSGDWPIENINFEDLYPKGRLAKEMTKELFYESLQQYFLSISQKTLLLPHEEGLYFLNGSNEKSILLVGLTHDYDNPMDYLKQQNPTDRYSVKNLRILSLRQQRGFVERGIAKDNRVKITTSAPLLFTAELQLK